MEWRGDQFIADVRRRFAQNLGKAGEFLADKMKQSVSEPYPPASSPGDPPHLRSGGLKEKITSSLDEETLTSRSGAAGKVPYWLETGTKKMAARPFARPALQNNLEQIRSIAVEGIGQEQT